MTALILNLNKPSLTSQPEGKAPANMNTRGNHQDYSAISPGRERPHLVHRRRLHMAGYSQRILINALNIHSNTLP
jgi:hypothetical protein